MTKIKDKHIKFLKEKVTNLDRFLPLSKDSIRDLFAHLHHLSTTNITNNFTHLYNLLISRTICKNDFYLIIAFIAE